MVETMICKITFSLFLRYNIWLFSLLFSNLLSAGGYDFELVKMEGGFVESRYEGQILLTPNSIIDWMVVSSENGGQTDHIIYFKENTVYFYRFMNGKWNLSTNPVSKWKKFNMPLDPTDISDLLFEYTILLEKSSSYPEIDSLTKSISYRSRKYKPYRYNKVEINILDSSIIKTQYYLNHLREKVQNNWTLSPLTLQEIKSVMELPSVNEILVSGAIQESRSYFDNLPNKKKIDLDSFEFMSLEYYPLDSSSGIFKDSIFKGKPIIIDFWYLGCKPCYQFQKALVDYLLENNLQDSFYVLRVNVYDKNADYIRKHLSKLEGEEIITFDYYLGYKSLINYEIQGFPMMGIIDKTGKTTYIQIGYSPELLKEFGLEMRKVLK